MTGMRVWAMSKRVYYYYTTVGVNLILKYLKVICRHLLSICIHTYVSARLCRLVIRAKHIQ